MNDSIQIEEIELERPRYFVQMNVDAGAASEFGIKPEVWVTGLASFVSDSILVQLRQDIFGRTLDEIKFPANWRGGKGTLCASLVSEALACAVYNLQDR